MTSHLPRDQRKLLESTVKRARVEAETGARAALHHLSVPSREPGAHLTPDERDLRNRLRARARQLGDIRDPDGAHGFARLVHATAYEHWHRMLFARFLAERGLLMHSTGVPVTLDDCKELAPTEGARDAWELAGRYAAAMLPQIFRPDDPVLAVQMPPETQQALESLLSALAPAVFQAKDALGWVYQFWQAQKKDEVNKSEVKIGADELPAVTQLFTEPYMVLFLLHNTLGAWWAGKVLAADAALATTAADEAALRDACALPGVEWTYLRFVRDDDTWRPAAGTFAGWPKHAREILALDPCCGSGHFLVGMLEILTALRAAEEGLDVAAACDAVLRDNLHGLEIDPRCTELAAFAVALAAWSLPGVAGVRPLPPLKIACSGLSMGVDLETWRAFASDEPRLVGEIDQLWRDFENAPVLGSLIQPRKVFGDLFAPQSGRLVTYLARRAQLERFAVEAETRELAVTALGAATAADMLAKHYQLVATNVPYLGWGHQTETLQAYCERNHKAAKADLAAVFVDRCAAASEQGGTVALVTPSSWLYQDGYKGLRSSLLKERQWNALARLGPRAFETISGEIVNVILVVLSTVRPGAADATATWDVAPERTPSDKSNALGSLRTEVIRQEDQLRNAGSIISTKGASSLPLLGAFAGCFQGLSTGDNPRHLIAFWELSVRDAAKWEWFQVPVAETTDFGGRTTIVSRALVQHGSAGAAIRGGEAWGRRGIALSRVGSLAVTRYDGPFFANTVPVIVPTDEANLPAIWAFTTAPDFVNAIRDMNQSLSVDNGYVTKIPFDLAHWTAVAAEKYPNGLPKPHSDDPTQWLFDGRPRRATQPLQVAVARLRNLSTSLRHIAVRV